MQILEHVPARARLDRYRDADVAKGGSLVAVARRADASRGTAIMLAAGASITGGLAMGTMSLGLFLFLHVIVLASASVGLTFAALRAAARALARLRLEVRGVRLVARVSGIPRREVVLETSAVRALDVLEIARPRSGADEVALIARLADESVMVLLEPLSREDAWSLVDLASSALGLERAER